MARAREMQGVSAQKQFLKGDGTRRWPSQCKFRKGKQEDYLCLCENNTNRYLCSCHTAKNCEYFMNKKTENLGG